MKTGLYPPLRQCLGGSPPRGSSRLRVHAMMEKVEFAFVLCYWRRRKNTKRYVLLNLCLCGCSKSCMHLLPFVVQEYGTGTYIL